MKIIYKKVLNLLKSKIIKKINIKISLKCVLMYIIPPFII
ncbi:hypothetical protein ACFW04_004074 [Cataglyphis niger]